MQTAQDEPQKKRTSDPVSYDSNTGSLTPATLSVLALQRTAAGRGVSSTCHNKIGGHVRSQPEPSPQVATTAKRGGRGWRRKGRGDGSRTGIFDCASFSRRYLPICSRKQGCRIHSCCQISAACLYFYCAGKATGIHDTTWQGIAVPYETNSLYQVQDNVRAKQRQQLRPGGEQNLRRGHSRYPLEPCRPSPLSSVDNSGPMRQTKQCLPVSPILVSKLRPHSRTTPTPKDTSNNEAFF